MASSASSDDREEQLLLAHHAAASPALRYSAVHPVHVDGWLAKEGKALRSRRTRYLRLNAHILSSHRTKSSPPSWQISVADAIVERGPHSREIRISLPHRSLSLIAPSQSAFDTWVVALRRASVVSSRVDDYYKIGRLIGEGMNGQVRLAQDMLTDETVAIKMVPRLGRENETQFLAREVQIILSVNHPNIVNTIDVFVTRRRIHFVMEYLAGGELFDFIAENTHFTETHAATVMTDLLNALSYLHARGIAHRDVKLENLLCANSTWPLNVKLADFGFANYVNSGNEPMLSSFVGTPYYIAPEMLRADPHGRPVDMWASGVVLYILLSGKFPFGGKNETEYYQRVLSKEAYFPSQEWANVSEEAKDLVRGLLCKDPRRRLTAEQCLRHPWLLRTHGVPEIDHNDLFPRDTPRLRSEVNLPSPNALRTNREKRGRWRQLAMLNHSVSHSANPSSDGRHPKHARTDFSLRTTAFNTEGNQRIPTDGPPVNRRPSLIRRLLSSGKLSLDRYDGRFPSFRGTVEEADEASATPRKTLSLFAKDGPLRRSFHRVGERVVDHRGAGFPSGISGGNIENGINFVNSQSQRLPPKVARERQRQQRQKAETSRKAARTTGVGLFSSHRRSSASANNGSRGNRAIGDAGIQNLYDASVGTGSNIGVQSGHVAVNPSSVMHFSQSTAVYHSSPRLHVPAFHALQIRPLSNRQGSSPSLHRRQRGKKTLALAKVFDSDVLHYANLARNMDTRQEDIVEDDSVRRTVSADVTLSDRVDDVDMVKSDALSRHEQNISDFGQFGSHGRLATDLEYVETTTQSDRVDNVDMVKSDALSRQQNVSGFSHFESNGRLATDLEFVQTTTLRP